MSRVTPPVNTITHALRRGISSGLLDSESRASRYLPRNLKDLRAECKKRSLNAMGNKTELVGRLAAHDSVGSHSFHTNGLHRPVLANSEPVYRTIPLMQGFHKSAPKHAAHDHSTIDFFFFPQIEAAAGDSLQKLRVPLLPDNFHPDRSAESGNALESLDEAVPRPEISIVAAHPENVVPAAMSEVVGNDGLDVDIGQLTNPAFSSILPAAKEPSVMQEIWSGIVDDLLGPKSPKVAM
ncbi:hypothetical protein PZA11_003618 [Diplocarpon coronariae]|uniref:SAP domain-containing protein n=1 Tax=Diplocarpon coronariae TaxID=2795749 RepID=A0A218ZHU2_9HELO|nr:hypothetical protein JHW43_006203 [Diplocarpon mali]OWP06845.1 hypothetical protein B2J93_3841 [Marssonina coronariae]